MLIFALVNTRKRIMRKTFFVFLAALALAAFNPSDQTVSAQKSTNKQPAWITKAPTVKNSYVGVANVSKRAVNPDSEAAENSLEQISSSIIVSQMFFNDKYKESGRKEAQKKILGMLHLAVDPNSLLGDLIMKGAYTASFDDVFIERVLETPMLKLQGEWEDDNEYWCYYTLTEADYQALMTNLEDSICRQAQTIWELGKSYQQDGLLFNAAKSYTDALNAIHPLIYTQHQIKYDFETIDLFKAIYDSYVHVYDNLKITPSITEVPAVAGEAVPATFTVNIDQNGTPVQKVSVILDYDGMTEGNFVTDEKGNVTFSIAKATEEPLQTISFSLDKEGLFDLPSTYAFKQLTASADRFGTAEVYVKLFDPTTYIYLNVSPADSVTDKAVRDIVAERKDLSIVADKSKADIIMETAISTKMEQQSVSAEKWSISKYNSALKIKVQQAATGKDLFEYSIEDFQYLSPASRKQDQVLHASAKEMSRQVTREFADKFKPFSYDKRGIVWSQIKGEQD